MKDLAPIVLLVVAAVLTCVAIVKTAPQSYIDDDTEMIWILVAAAS